MEFKQFPSDKIIPAAALRGVCEDLHRIGQRLVLVNGCFDLLHPGHVCLLRTARAMGDKLVVAINSDESVRTLKGAGRPVMTADDRATLLAAIQSVSFVTIFSEVRAAGVIRAVKPDVYVKGGDYTPETIEESEREALRECGATVRILPTQTFGGGKAHTSEVLAGLSGSAR